MSDHEKEWAEESKYERAIFSLHVIALDSELQKPGEHRAPIKVLTTPPMPASPQEWADLCLAIRGVAERLEQVLAQQGVAIIKGPPPKTEDGRSLVLVR